MTSSSPSLLKNLDSWIPKLKTKIGKKDFLKNFNIFPYKEVIELKLEFSTFYILEKFNQNEKSNQTNQANLNLG